MYTGDEVALRPLLFYTCLPQLWEIFNLSCSLSAFDADGLPSLSNITAVINFNDAELNISYTDFWAAMSYFLHRLRKQILAERRK